MISRAFRAVCAAVFILGGGCDGGGDPSAPGDGADGPVDEATVDAPVDEDTTADTRLDADAAGADGADGSADDLSSDVPAEGSEAPPGFSVDAATRAFKLYYRERVDRTLVSFNRFGMFGDVGWATVNGKVYVDRQGGALSMIPGPTDNNLIGTSIWGTYAAYRAFRSEIQALTLVRMFEGLVVFEQITGHEGLTSRQFFPGWTLTIDSDGTVSRARHGVPFETPHRADPTTEARIVELFFGGGRYTYRLDPSETFFDFHPAAEPEIYAVTLSFSFLPAYLASSDCCSSLMRTPDDRLWGGAFWGNHNSRDNFPDLALGLLAARLAKDDPSADPRVRDAARRAFEAGRRIGDLAQEHEGTLMTVGERTPYDELVVGGGVRPHGLPENENLGTMSACPMAYLSRALSTQGLTLPLPELPLPGTVERLLDEETEGLVECEVPEGTRMCSSYADAYCGFQWSEFDQVRILGQPWFDLARTMERANPGSAEDLFGAFQNDLDDVVEAMLAIVHYAGIAGDDALAADARASLASLTDLMRAFADVIWETSNPEKRARQRYEAAVFDALSGRATFAADLGAFEAEEQKMQRIEALLSLGDSAPWELRDGAALAESIEAAVASKASSEYQYPAAERYRAEYGTDAPVRRTGDGYEARGTPLADHPWRAIDNPAHHRIGGLELLQALHICHADTQILDCTWAALGCAAADVDRSGVVDAVDAAAVDARAGETCAAPAWCDGADLDRSGTVDAMDVAFMTAAQGCWYSP